MLVWERGSADCLIQESYGQQLEATESISAWFQCSDVKAAPVMQEQCSDPVILVDMPDFLSHLRKYSLYCDFLRNLRFL